MNGMNIRRQAKEAIEKASGTLEDVSTASKKVVTSTEWATIALVAVAALSVVALAIGVIALGKASNAARV
jgi:hypothetical protein